MRLGRSWDVPDEFWRLWWRSRQLRKLIMQVDGEPAGKGPAGKRSAPEFQRQVMDEMESCRRYPMTGPVALDLHFLPGALADYAQHPVPGVLAEVGGVGGGGDQGAGLVPVKAHRGGVVRIDHRPGHTLGGDPADQVVGRAVPVERGQR
jgi:hypothetical protein